MNWYRPMWIWTLIDRFLVPVSLKRNPCNRGRKVNCQHYVLSILNIYHNCISYLVKKKKCKIWKFWIIIYLTFDIHTRSSKCKSCVHISCYFHLLWIFVLELIIIDRWSGNILRKSHINDWNFFCIYHI